MTNGNDNDARGALTERQQFEEWICSVWLIGGSFVDHYRVMDAQARREVDCAWRAWSGRAELSAHSLPAGDGLTDEQLQAAAVMMSRHSRAMLLNVLWHHQGGSSPVGQPIRALLGIGQHDRLNDEQLSEAKWIDGLLAAPRQPVAVCSHRIADMQNEHIESGFMCVDCNAVFAAAAPRHPGEMDAGVQCECGRSDGKHDRSCPVHKITRAESVARSAKMYEALAARVAPECKSKVDCGLAQTCLYAASAQQDERKCPRCGQPADLLFTFEGDGEELGTTHCGCLHDGEPAPKAAQQDEREAFTAYNPLAYAQMDGWAVWQAACAWQRSQQVQADAGAVAEANDLLRACHRWHAGDGHTKKRIENVREALAARLSPAGESDKRDAKRYLSIPAEVDAAIDAGFAESKRESEDAEMFRFLCAHPDWKFIEDLCRSFVGESAETFYQGLKLAIRAAMSREQSGGVRA